MLTEVEIHSHRLALANQVLRHVLPLFRIQRGKRPALIGTCLLLLADADTFLVSARHVLDHAEPPGSLYYYFEQAGLQKVVGTFVRTGPQPHLSGRDPYDVSIVRLQPEALRPLSPILKSPLPASALLSLHLPRAGKEYLITGFPRSRSRANPHTKRLLSEPSGFRVVSAPPAAYEGLDLSDQTHLVLSLDIANMRFPDGTHRRIPDPHGMSGSPVWLVPEDSMAQADRRIEPRVVGVVTEYHERHKLLVATDVGVVLHLIAESAA